MFLPLEYTSRHFRSMLAVQNCDSNIIFQFGCIKLQISEFLNLTIQKATIYILYNPTVSILSCFAHQNLEYSIADMGLLLSLSSVTQNDKTTKCNEKET